jgi:hypothetical protein
MIYSNQQIGVGLGHSYFCPLRRQYALEVYDRALDWAKTDPHRWSHLLKPLPHVGREPLEKLFSHLERLMPPPRWWPRPPMRPMSIFTKTRQPEFVTSCV